MVLADFVPTDLSAVYHVRDRGGGLLPVPYLADAEGLLPEREQLAERESGAPHGDSYQAAKDDGNTQVGGKVLFWVISGWAGLGWARLG